MGNREERERQGERVWGRGRDRGVGEDQERGKERQMKGNRNMGQICREILWHGGQLWDSTLGRGLWVMALGG